MLALLALLSTALALPAPQTLTWNLTIQGQPVGTRTATVKYFESSGASPLRMVESWTEVDGTVGPVRVQYKQRLTAHAENDAASFQSVVDQNGTPREVQGRLSGAGWKVIVAEGGRQRTYDLDYGKIQLSTADLLDPDSRVQLGAYSTVRLLSAETGDIYEGTVKSLGPKDVKIGEQFIPTQAWSWTGPQGDSEFYWTEEGYLVRYKMRLLGIVLEGTLTKAPPGGSDEFPVSFGRPAVEVIDL